MPDASLNLKRKSVKAIQVPPTTKGRSFLFRRVRHQTRFGQLKGLGHAILGNFSTDQMVTELTKI